jgi:hypothetical protein
VTEKVKEQIKEVIKKLGEHKLLLGIIQVGMVMFLPMTVVILVGCPFTMPSFDLRKIAFFCTDIEWNLEQYPWSIFDFGELKFVDNLQVVVILWVIGIVSLLTKEILQSQRLVLKLITLQGQLMLIGYGVGSIIAQRLDTMVRNASCLALSPPSNPYQVFTIYYFIAVFISGIIIHSEWKEIKEIKKKHDLENGTDMWVFSAIKIANFFGISWVLITNYRFLELFFELVKARTSLSFANDPFEAVAHTFSFFLLVNLIFISYFIKRKKEISSNAGSYLFYFLFTILGWAILLDNINPFPFAEDYSFFHPDSFTRDIMVLTSVITLIWFSPALIYSIQNRFGMLTSSKYRYNTFDDWK